MKKIYLVTIASLIVLGTTAQTTTPQPVLATFENFALSANSFYKDTNNVPFQTSSAIFQHEWVMGNYPFWSAGFSYTNKYDSTTAGYTNLYGVIPYKGYANSTIYVVGQDKGIIRTTNKSTVVDGFYYTNTTYAYKSMLFGDNFARKFGDTTGTGSGTTIAQGAYPDYFKLVIFGYKNGSKKSDSVEVYLADYRFANSAQDYLVNDWRYVSTAVLGSVDSIQFVMRSSVYNQYGMLTPGFFAIDNFQTSTENPVGIAKEPASYLYGVYPIPAKDELTITAPSQFLYCIINANGTEVIKNYAGQKAVVPLSELQSGIYYLQIIDEFGMHTKTLVKE